MSLLTINPFYLPTSSTVNPEKQTCTISEKVSQLSYAVLFPLNLLLDSIESTLSIIKKINRNILPLTELKNLPLVKVLDSSISIMNGLQIASHLDYLINTKYLKDNIQAIAGNITLLLSQATESMVWMIKIAGSTYLFALIARFKVDLLVPGSLALSHFLFSTDALYRLIHAKNGAESALRKIELAKHTAECTLAITMIGSTLSTLPIAVLASVCIGLEFLRLIHKEKHVDNI